MKPEHHAESTEEATELSCASGISAGKRVELYRQALESAQLLSDSALVAKCFESLLELDSPAASEEISGMINYLRDQLSADGFRFGGQELESGAKVLLSQLALWSNRETLVLEYFADELKQERGLSELKQSALCACDLLSESTEAAFCGFLNELLRRSPAHYRDELVCSLIGEGLFGRRLGAELLSLMPELAELGPRAERATLDLFQQLGHRAAAVSGKLVGQALEAEPSRAVLCFELLARIGADAKPALEERMAELSGRAALFSGANDGRSPHQETLQRCFLSCIGKIFGSHYLNRLGGED